VCIGICIVFAFHHPHLFHDKQLAGDRRVETEEICQQANILFAQVEKIQKNTKKMNTLNFFLEKRKNRLPCYKE
jgi:hypothetical protein